MPYKTALEIEIVDTYGHLQQEMVGWIVDEGRRGPHVPVRLSFSRWRPSVGEWEHFGGYRSRDVNWYHRDDCHHRPGVPRSYHDEELNFHPQITTSCEKQLMCDPSVSGTNRDKLEEIELQQKLNILDNIHLILRREDDRLFLDFLMRDVEYWPRISSVEFREHNLQFVREHEAMICHPLEPCQYCVQDGCFDIAVDMENVHGAYGEGMQITGIEGVLNVMKTHSCLSIKMPNGGRLIISKGILESLKGYSFSSIKCHPPV